MKTLGAIALMLALGTYVSAQDVDTVNPDRPSFSTSTYVVAEKHTQLEGGFTRLRFGSLTSYEIGQVFVRVGVSKHVEIRGGVPSYLVGNGPAGRVTGADDALVESKLLFMSGRRVALGALASATLPTGARDVAEHTFQPGATFIADVTASKCVSLTTNAGYTRATAAGIRYDAVSGVLTANVSVSSRTGFFTEFFAFNQPHDTPQKYVGFGGALRIGKRTSIDASGGFGIRNRAGGPDRYFGAGISQFF
jgi:hypothetical protein